MIANDRNGIKMSNNSSRQAYYLVVPCVLFSLSQIVIHTILPQIILELVCLENRSTANCNDSDTSSKASIINMISFTLVNIPCIFIIGFYNSFANKYGLKHALTAPVVGNFLFLSFILAAFHMKSYKAVIMIGSIFCGISGSRSTFIMATFAYAADISTQQERSDVFSLIEASIYCAKIGCPITIGILSNHYGFDISLILGIFSSLVNIIWILFVMKDPIPNEGIDPSLLQANCSDEFRSNGNKEDLKLTFHPLATFHSLGLLCDSNRITIPFISAVYFLYHFIAAGVHPLEILYMKYAFDWNAEDIGLFGSLSGFIEITSMLLAPVIAARLLRLEMSDLNWIGTSLWAKALFFFLFGLANFSIQLYLILCILILCGPIVPRIRSYLSKAVKLEEQSNLFAALAALDAISAFLSPVFLAAYSQTVFYCPGCVFEIIGFSFVLSSLIIVFMRCRYQALMLEYLPISESS
jgi:MFS family permease